VGATCLLVDEDRAASNFMIRDARMLVSGGQTSEVPAVQLLAQTLV
jgi:predicted ABC-class ATPase